MVQKNICKMSAVHTACDLDVGGPKKQVHSIGGVWQKAPLDDAIHCREDLIVGHGGALQKSAEQHVKTHGSREGEQAQRCNVLTAEHLITCHMLRGVSHMHFISPLWIPKEETGGNREGKQRYLVARPILHNSTAAILDNVGHLAILVGVGARCAKPCSRHTLQCHFNKLCNLYLKYCGTVAV